MTRSGPEGDHELAWRLDMISNAESLDARVLALGGKEGDGCASSACSSCSANAVNIVFRVVRVVIVQNMRNVANIFEKG